MMRFENACNTYISTLRTVKKYAAHTILAYQADLKQLLEFLQLQRQETEISLESINKADLQQYLSGLMRHGMAKRTVARKLASLRAFFKYSARMKWIVQDPSMSLVFPKLEKPLPHFLDENEVFKALESVQPDGREHARDRAILELFYGTGMRLSELTGIEVHDLDLSSGLIKVTGKGSKDRILPVGKHCAKYLKIYLEKRNEFKPAVSESAMFLNPSGKRLSGRSVQNIVRMWLEKVSEKQKLSPHILRHTFATHLLDHGADLRAVKDLLGHESLSTTQVYTHLTVDRLRKVYEQAFPRAES